MTNGRDRWPPRLAQGSYAWPGHSNRDEIPLDWYILDRWSREWKVFREASLAAVKEPLFLSQVELDIADEGAFSRYRGLMLRSAESNAWRQFCEMHALPASAVSSVELSEAQERFLISVTTIEPAVLHDLAGVPFEAFVEAWNLKPESQKANQDSESLESLFGSPAEAVDAVWEALENWAIRWNVTASWWLRRAYDALAYWRLYGVPNPTEWSTLYSVRRGWYLGSHSMSQSPAWYAWRSENHGSSSPIPDNERSFYFMTLWEPWNETRSDARARIRKHFGDLLEEYFDRTEQYVKESGAVRVREKREPEHFEWLVKYQVSGESFAAIAHNAYRDRMTVTDGVKEVAQLIQLPLRAPGRPGRPSRVK